MLLSLSLISKYSGKAAHKRGYIGESTTKKYIWVTKMGPSKRWPICDKIACFDSIWLWKAYHPRRYQKEINQRKTWSDLMKRFRSKLLRIILQFCWLKEGNCILFLWAWYWWICCAGKIVVVELTGGGSSSQEYWWLKFSNSMQGKIVVVLVLIGNSGQEYDHRWWWSWAIDSEGGKLARVDRVRRIEGKAGCS